MRWSENVTCQFVKLYLSHQCLWNTAHPYYKLKSRKLIAYRDLITQFKETTGILLNELEAKIKIKNLKSTYAQELLKIKQRSSTEFTYQPSIKWFSEWHRSFSRSKSDEDPPYDNQDNEDSTEVCPKVWVSQNESEFGEETSDPFHNDDEYTTVVLKSEPRDLHNESNKYLSSTKKIKHRSPSTDCSDKNYQSSIDSNATSSKEDEFDIYGKYIATQLRNMGLQKALRVQLEIQSIVSEARMSDLKQ